jgi:UDP-hydrolysing UDP-N-acetyl-D-glucosamine 2-epimerase/N-acetylneuraminate synthase
MNAKMKTCVVTGSRAEYGLLFLLMKRIQEDPDMQLQLVVTGAHLSKEFGNTQQVIENDGFTISSRIPILTDDNSLRGITWSLGQAVAGFADTFKALKPDLVCLLGDRYEVFAAAQAALIAKIPIAHIAGGDVTEGAFDESLRHGITKMSHFHFVTNSISEQRVKQLGENPDCIFNVGYTGIDQIKRLKLLDRSELEQELKFKFRKKNLLITFHPTTLDDIPATDQFEDLLTSLDRLGNHVGLVFTGPNADPEGKQLIRLLETFVSRKNQAVYFASLGQKRYFSAMAQVDAVVGNSSSGMYEAPSFNVPTVNIGSRQDGRLRASSVIDCKATVQAISSALRRALSTELETTVSPYGDGNSSDRIFDVIKSIENPKSFLKKQFFFTTPKRGVRSVCVIAEAGVNHNGSLDAAKQLIDAASAAGADAIKFQTFRSDQIASKNAPKADYQKKATGTRESQLDMLKRLELDHGAHRELLLHAKKRKIEFLSTPFDDASVDFLSSLKLTRLKVPSGELTNAPLLLKIARTRLPLIISTGMATLEEVQEALGVIAFAWMCATEKQPNRGRFSAALLSINGKRAIRENVTLLQCTTDYPTSFSDVNLLAMDTLQQKFGTKVGLSDHSLGITAALAAAARGASIIEKHITLDRKQPGPDHRASLEPAEFGSMVKAIRDVEQALGSADKFPTPTEIMNRHVARRGLRTTRSVQKGQSFTDQDLVARRPDVGLSPMLYWELLGKRADRSYQANEVVKS